MPVGYARLKTSRFRLTRTGYSCGLALLIFLFGSKALQNAIAEGETRSISMHHLHTGEDITITYKREGRYDEGALEKLNWFLRDWRRGEETRMDPHLIDLVWEVQRETGAKQPIDVVCGYRSPQTNAMLRRRSSGVARFSQHMLGHAMDFYIPGVPLAELRVIGLRLERGGVGFYPTSGSPFVHMDTGGVRMWPRMSREQLLHVFPDGRTAYIPSDGRPLPGYALALADIRKRGQVPGGVASDEDGDLGAGDGNIVLASDDHTSTNPVAKFFALLKGGPQNDDGTATASAASATDAPAPASAAAPPPASKAQLQPANGLLAALHREARRLAAALHTRNGNANGTAAPANQPLMQTASYVTTAPRSEGAPQTTGPQPLEVAGAMPQTTGAISPWASEDHVPPEFALSYATQPEQQTPQASPLMPAKASPNAAALGQSHPSAPPPATTIVVKASTDAAVSTIDAAQPRLSPAMARQMHLGDPWMRAVLLSPSVHEFLTTLELGEYDYRTLAALMVKPDSAVLMTFAAEPNPGLSDNHFSGSAIVFVSTVTTHTALR